MFEIRIKDDRIPAFRVVKGANMEDAEVRADAQLRIWEERWQRREEISRARHLKEQKFGSLLDGKSKAQELTSEYQSLIRSLELLLIRGCDETILTWRDLKEQLQFSEKQPSKPKVSDLPQQPEPSLFVPELTLLDKLLTGRKSKKLDEAHQRHTQAFSAWSSKCKSIKDNDAEAESAYQQALSAVTARKESFELSQKKQHERIESIRQLYLAGDQNSVEYLASEALTHSEYPAGFSPGFELKFDSNGKLLVVDFELPNQDYLPKHKEVRYVASKGELHFVPVAESWKKSTYDSVLYQTALRTIHRLFGVDEQSIIQTIVFNGWVHSIDRSTGAEVHACILSLQAGRDEFMCLDLTRVDPRACFKSLKGVASSKLVDLTPIRPIMKLSKEDVRFVEAYAVAEHLDERTNLAAMDWQDFENLIREVFEKEFSREGAEVKITRASRDGGVDAVVFDPDPLRGGKIVIQAKRYTNTVGVSAVRDLFGTVQHEGAMKGILVTTATYGNDAYEFARDKPITLISGGELLSMLERHGHPAKINLAEARALRDEA